MILLSGRSLGEPDEYDEEEEPENQGPGGAGNADNLPGGTPNIPDVSGKEVMQPSMVKIECQSTSIRK